MLFISSSSVTVVNNFFFCQHFLSTAVIETALIDMVSEDEAVVRKAAEETSGKMVTTTRDSKFITIVCIFSFLF